MGTVDQAGEWLRLTEHYRRMTDGELTAVAEHRNQLTEIAQQVLAIEISARRLKLEPDKKVLPEAFRVTTPPKAPLRARLNHDDSHDDTGASAYAGDPYAQDRELVEILTVWSLRDALEVQR